MALMPAANPFTKFDRQSALGTFKATGSRDQDVLHSVALTPDAYRLPPRRPDLQHDRDQAAPPENSLRAHGHNRINRRRPPRRHPRRHHRRHHQHRRR